MADLTRRQFLGAASAVGGSFVLGFHLPVLGATTPLPVSEINAWIVIARDSTVTIRVAQSEMGQGIMTALPMIVGEELEVDWRKVKVEYASAVRNLTGARELGGKLVGEYRRMRTEGSSAVRTSRPYLQAAGAEARERLIKAAAERWGVAAGECFADYGEIHHQSSGNRVAFGEVAELAAAINIANLPAPRTPRDYKLVGLATPAIDAAEKVDGSAIYGMDVRVENMVYAAVRHCPVLGGTLRSYRFNAVRNMPGVLQSVRLPDGVAVVADHYWQAQSALADMPMDWMTGDLAKVHTDAMVREFVGQLDTPGVVVDREGQPEQRMDEAEITIESDYVVPYLSHACMEPMNCTVEVREGQVRIWGGFQDPEGAVRLAAQRTGLEISQVELTNTKLGGGFGRRSHLDIVDEALTIAIAVRRPVQVIWSREEDQRRGRYRPMAAARFKAGFDLDKQLIAYTSHSVTHSISRDLNPRFDMQRPDPMSLQGMLDHPYKLGTRSITHSNHNTHLTSWFWRSVGHSQNAYMLECFIDEMAVATKADPLAFRVTLASGNSRFVNVLQELKKAAGWGRSMKRGSAQGIAIHESFGTIVGQVAEVTVADDGSMAVDRIVSVVDCGNVVNPLGAEAQIEGATIFGLTAALYGKLTVDNGAIQETNFDQYLLLRMDEVPTFETHFIQATDDRFGGLGEPATPPVAPAVCNALYRITRRRIRQLPIREYYLQIA